MPSKPAVLSCMKFFFLFHSLPHPRSWQFYFLISLRFVPCHPFCPPPSAGAISAAPLLITPPHSPQCPSPQRHVGPHTEVAAPLQGLQSPPCCWSLTSELLPTPVLRLVHSPPHTLASSFAFQSCAMSDDQPTVLPFGHQPF